MNSYQLFLSEKAIEDVNDIILWYKEQQPGLENKFLSDLRGYYRQIIVHPEIHGFNRITPQFRYVRLKRFPYYVLYTVDLLTIRIIGIVHTARSPKFVHRRYQ